MTAFITWLSQYGSVIGFFAQIFFWIAISVAALWSTLLFKRLVDARVGETTPAVSAPEPEAWAGAEQISVEEFVD